MRQRMDETKRSSIQETILDAAKGIVEEEGFEGLSIRKVAKEVGYTPGSIYQYFDGKEALLRALILSGYQTIMASTMKPLDPGLSIREEIIERFKHYTKAALRNPEYYKAVMLSEDPVIQSMTHVLSGAQDTPPKGLKMLMALLEKGVEAGIFRPMDIRSTAQVLWTANFGLTLRLIIEKYPRDDTTIKSLVDKELALFLDGLERKEA
ncbi:MAG: TetR/AcrR family transcriptional regulator [Candidatus Izemoplasmataceae bacterium]